MVTHQWWGTARNFNWAVPGSTQMLENMRVLHSFFGKRLSLPIGKRKNGTQLVKANAASTRNAQELSIIHCWNSTRTNRIRLPDVRKNDDVNHHSDATNKSYPVIPNASRVSSRPERAACLFPTQLMSQRLDLGLSPAKPPRAALLWRCFQVLLQCFGQHIHTPNSYGHLLVISWC